MFSIRITQCLGQIFGCVYHAFVRKLWWPRGDGRNPFPNPSNTKLVNRETRLGCVFRLFHKANDPNIDVFAFKDAKGLEMLRNLAGLGVNDVAQDPWLMTVSWTKSARQVRDFECQGDAQICSHPLVCIDEGTAKGVTIRTICNGRTQNFRTHAKLGHQK